MMNILFMLVMVLMGMSAFLPIGVITVQAPQFGGAPGPAMSARPELNLTVMILRSGFKLSMGGEIPKSSTGYNFSALREKLREIKAQYPQDRRIILMAEPDVIYDDITHVMDAARPMFDEVAFSPGVVQ
jgi:biopolymer transport protein ExbD